MGLTFSNYVLQPFFEDCIVPVEAAQLLAAATICKCFFPAIIHGYISKHIFSCKFQVFLHSSMDMMSSLQQNFRIYSCLQKLQLSLLL